MQKLIENAKRIVIIQAENPDGDSIGSALALEQILGDLGKEVALYCPVQIPTYQRYLPGWDRISIDFDITADLGIIVDTTSGTLLSKAIDQPVVNAWFNSHKTIVLDHHADVEPTLPFDAEYNISKTAVSTGELIYGLAKENNWKINKLAAENLYTSIQSDSLGLTTEATTADSFRVCADLIDLGVNVAEIEERRRESFKKSQRILEYKGKLIERIEYFSDGRLALIHIPFEEIQEYSDEYNPTVLVLDEMRLVTGVDVAIGTKTYPDGKITAKIRSNLPISNEIAGAFGGGGHKFASGFRVYEDDYETFENELIKVTDKILLDYHRDE